MPPFGSPPRGSGGAPGGGSGRRPLRRQRHRLAQRPGAAHHQRGQHATAAEHREREVLRLRFEEDLTQSEIGARVGVSQMHVSRLIRQSIARLRAEAEGQ